MKILNSEALSFFYKNGFLVLNNYLSLFDTDAVLDSIDNLTIDALVKLESQWQNRKICFFSTSKGQNKSHANDFVKDSYFLASRDASHIFFEQIDDQCQINRIGHALHKEDYYPRLKAVINNRMIELLQQLGYQRPVCHLSVYITKHGNGIGSFVRPPSGKYFRVYGASECFGFMDCIRGCRCNECLYVGNTRKPPLAFEIYFSSR